MGRALHKHAGDVCTSDCHVCRAASFLHSRRISEARQPTSASSSLQASPTAARAPSGGLAAALAAAASSGSLSSSAAARNEPPSPAVHGLAASASGSPSPHFLLPAASASERHRGEEWREVEGEFASIMLIVMPCRSDKVGGRGGM